MKHNYGRLLCSLALSGIILSSCGTSAHIEKDRNADFSKYKTYTWLPKEDQKAINHKNDIAESNIRSTVDAELQKNGYKNVKISPDLLLSYDILVEKSEKQQSDPVYSRSYSRLYYNPYSGRYQNIYFPSQFLGYETSTIPVKEGTVTISLIDSKTDKTVWQGSTTEEINNGQLSSRELERDIKAIFRKFDMQRM